MSRIVLIFFLVLAILSGNSCSVKSLQSPCSKPFLPKNILKLDQNNLLSLKSSLKNDLKCNKKGCPNALLAYIYSLEGKLDFSEEHIAKAIKELPEFEPYLLFMSAKNNAEKNNYKQAKTIIESILGKKSFQNQNLFLRTKFLLADIAMQEKDYNKSSKLYHELLEKGYSQKEVLLYNLAFSLEKTGNMQEANEVYKRLLTEFPSSLLVKNAQHFKQFTDFHFSLVEQEKIFDKLIEELKFNEAINKINLALQNNNYNVAEKDELMRLKTKALIFSNQFNEAIKTSKHAVKNNKSSENLDNYAFSLAKVNRHIQASKNYLKAFALNKNKEAKAKSCFFAGFSLYEANLYPMAQFAWSSCENAVYATPIHEELLWYQALSYIMMEQHSLAEEKLKTLIAKFTKSQQKEKYSFFLAFCFERGFKNDLARHIYKELSEHKTPSYYSIMSARKIGLEKTKGKKVDQKDLVHLTANIGEEKNNAVLLYNLGFAQEAKEYIERSKLTKEQKILVLKHLKQTNSVLQKSHLVNSKIQVDKNKIKASSYARTSFPQIHLSAVEQACKKYSLPKSIVYAVMKAESVFKESAKSNRGALGLMQIMPHVADKLALKLNIDEFKNHLLLEPKINIDFGSLMLGMLKKQFAHPHLMLAAYNAGPDNVKKWLRYFGHLPFELFVERIPFKQTREYVKKVLLYESLYAALDGHDLRLLI